MATDTAAVESIKEQVNENDIIITKPPERVVEKLLSKIAKPENTGSIHLRLMVKSPHDYKVSKSLVELTIKAFYSLLWFPENKQWGDKLMLEILTGAPNEQGFLTLRPGAICTTNNDGP